MTEFHRITALALGQAFQLGVIVRHRTERQVRLDGHEATTQGFSATDSCTPPGEVTGNVAHVLIGHGDINTDNGLQDLCPGRIDAVKKRMTSGDHKGDFLGIHRMVFAIVDFDFEILQGITGDCAFIQNLANSFFDCWNQVGRDRGSDNLVNEGETFSASTWPYTQEYLTELAGAAGLQIVELAFPATEFIGPDPSADVALYTPYLSVADSPWALGAVDFSAGYFHLEDFENNMSGIPITTPGATGLIGGPMTSVCCPNDHDSVDADDGAIDGSGLGGESWYAIGSSGVRFEFDEVVLGSYPTHAGFVFTDGSTIGETLTFEAYDTTGAITAGIFIDEVTGHLHVHTVETTRDVSLRTTGGSGSILDARNDINANILGQTIDLDANGSDASIGESNNELEIDSRVGSLENSRRTFSIRGRSR